MKVVIFAGAGTSAELGVPTMRPMALDLLSHIEMSAPSPRLRDALHKRVEEAGGDLESIVEDIDKLCDAQGILPAYGAPVDQELIDAATWLRAEVEWFVQHACERIRVEQAAALWGSVLTRDSNIAVTIATTNYDRAIEQACQRHGVALTDGFGSFEGREWTSWIGFDAGNTRLLKLHGSTDW